MAYLLDVNSEALFPLAPHHTFGRLATAVDTHIEKPYISKLHAAIEWTGETWRIKNLGLNGTWVNDLALNQGDSHELAIGDLIYLAEQTDPGFKVINLHPPADMLWPLDAQKNADGTYAEPIYLSRYHLLPDNQAPELAVFFNEQDQQWHQEAISNQSEQQSHLVQQGDMVQFNNTHWQLVRAQVYGPTEARSQQQVQQVTDYEFVFNLSLDEETTQLELRYQKQNIDLAVRSHHYLLLQLARHRAEDNATDLDSKSRGWVYAEQLATELGLDATHMNIQIFRARKQLADALPYALGQQYVLERRGGKIRFGGEKFKIYKGEKLITESQQPA